MLSTGETHLEFWVQLQTPEYERDMDILEHIHCRAINIIKELDLSYEERLRMLGLLSLEKRRFGEILSLCINP